ncbi:unnamed protein product [Paramecium primaurelia]|uniref:Uncharacterized protein n=1 Tax=Paramecium primaurelia TaxID=5886 RepID=A0A8S1MN66_PARPR|nr:unnamed protein product [Paramecium primaurelia]
MSKKNSKNLGINIKWNCFQEFKITYRTEEALVVQQCFGSMPSIWRSLHFKKFKVQKIHLQNDMKKQNYMWKMQIRMLKAIIKEEKIII